MPLDQSLIAHTPFESNDNPDHCFYSDRGYHLIRIPRWIFLLFNN